MIPITEYIRDMSVEERIVLVQYIWDTIAEDEGTYELTESEKAELDRRLETYDDAIERGLTWEDFVADWKFNRSANVELSENQRRELRRRRELYLANPDDVTPWELVRERIRAKRDD